MANEVKLSALNTYVGVWTFGILLVQTIFFILLLLFGYNWID